MGDPLQGNERRRVDFSGATLTVTNVGIEDSLGTRIDPATEQKQLPDNHQVTVSNQVTQPLTDAELRASAVDVEKTDFASLLKYEPLPGEELRRDAGLTDDYYGAAPDGTAEATAAWKVVRHYKTAGQIVRTRYRTGVAWSSRTTGWT